MRLGSNSMHAQPGREAASASTYGMRRHLIDGLEEKRHLRAQRGIVQIEQCGRHQPRRQAGDRWRFWMFSSLYHTMPISLSPFIGLFNTAVG